MVEAGSVADMYPASRWGAVGSRALMESAHARLNSGRSRRPLPTTGSWRVGPTCLAITSDSFRATVGGLHRPEEDAWCLRRSAMAGSVLTAMVNLFAAGGVGSPEGPERSEGAAKQLDTTRTAAFPASGPWSSFLCRIGGVKDNLAGQHRPCGTGVLVRQGHRGNVRSPALLDLHRPSTAPIRASPCGA